MTDRPQFDFGELNIFVTDLERSADFYTRILGFERLDMDRGCLHLKGAGQPFLLLPFAKPASNPAAYGKVPCLSFDLYVSDAKAACAYFMANGVDMERPLDEGETSFFIKDPDGIVIEVVQSDAES